MSEKEPRRPAAFDVADRKRFEARLTLIEDRIEEELVKFDAASKHIEARVTLLETWIEQHVVDTERRGIDEISPFVIRQARKILESERATAEESAKEDEPPLKVDVEALDCLSDEDLRKFLQARYGSLSSMYRALFKYSSSLDRFTKTKDEQSEPILDILVRAEIAALLQPPGNVYVKAEGIMADSYIKSALGNLRGMQKMRKRR